MSDNNNRKGALGACRRTRSGFERPFFRLAASGCIGDKTNIACFAVFARQKNARSRADDGILRQTPRQEGILLAFFGFAEIGSIEYK
jgi:hypothetical protein